MMTFCTCTSVRPVRCVRIEHGERANTDARKRSHRRSVAFVPFGFSRGQRTNERSAMACMRPGPLADGAGAGALSPMIFASAVKSHLENSNLESRFRVSREIDELVEC